MTAGPPTPRRPARSAATPVAGRRALRLLVAVSLSVLAACGGGQSSETAGGYTIYVHGGSVLPQGGEDALLEGELVVRDGCVLLAPAAGTALPVVWPSGTSIADDDPLALTLGSGSLVELGDRVRGSGGVHAADSEQVEVDIATGCLTGQGSDDNSVMVFDPDGQLTVSN